jgi:hypothetical protein
MNEDLSHREAPGIRYGLFDPDNWLVIPEFGAKPDDVKGHEGFMFPISGVGSTTVRENICDTVRLARKLAHKRFKTLAEYEVSLWQAYDAMSPESLTAEALTVPQREAMLFSLIMMAMKMIVRALDDPRVHPVEKSLEYFSTASKLLATWADQGAVTDAMVNRSMAAQARYSEAQSNRASKPRKLSEAVRHQIVKRYKELVANGGAYGARKLLAGKYNVSETTIGNILNRADKDSIDK